MKKLASISIACLLLSLAFYPLTNGNEEKAKIIIQLCTLNGIEKTEKRINIEKANKLLIKLENLEKAIKNKEDTIKLIHELEIYFIQEINVSWNLSNLFCLTFGFGEGAFLYMPENLLIIAALLGIIKISTFWDLIAFMAYVALFAIISHLVPFRAALPITFFAVAKGEVITVGLQGMKIFQPKNNMTVGGAIIGFIGLIINIIIPMKEKPISYFFCSGYSLLVLEPYFENTLNKLFFTYSR